MPCRRNAPQPSQSPNVLQTSRDWLNQRWDNLSPRGRITLIGTTAMVAMFGFGVSVGASLDGESKKASRIDLSDCPAGYESGSIVKRQAAVVHRLGELEIILANAVERNDNGKLLSDALDRVEDLADKDAVDAMCVSQDENHPGRILLSPEAERLAGQLDALGVEGFGDSIKRTS